MDLPRMPAKQTIEIPAVPAKIYPDRYVTEIVIRSPQGGTTSAAISHIPYNYELGEYGSMDSLIVTHVPDLYALATEMAINGDTSLAQALTAVITAIPAVLTI